MPRVARIRPADTDAYYHITNRVVGMPGDFPFDDVEKQKFISLTKKLSEFFTVEVITALVMSNHYHIVCFAPAETLPDEAVVERYNRFYGKKKPELSVNDPQCAEVARRMRNVSEFIGQLQQQFTAWFNSSRPQRRRGTLWADRFKSTILERETSLWNCLCYVEMNPVRAKMVSDPADYRFGTWGIWSASGKHPFAANLERHLPAFEGSAARARTLPEIETRFRTEFARICAWEHGKVGEEITKAMQDAEKRPSFALRADRRVRYWTDGLIIGSKTFVREMAARRWSEERVNKHRLQCSESDDDSPSPIYSWRRLRTA